MQNMMITDLPQGFSFAPAGSKVDAPAAAREFEALLIARLLKTAREAGEELADKSSETGAAGYMELAEEHVARLLAQRDAFGISQIILKSLREADTRINPAAAGTQPASGEPAAAAADLQTAVAALPPSCFPPDRR
jgi:Rod binding domain-containing protein